jgi:hypothetical protein
VIQIRKMLSTVKCLEVNSLYLKVVCRLAEMECRMLMGSDNWILSKIWCEKRIMGGF